MDAAAIREAFKAFIGTEDFNRFVRAINTAPERLSRLRWWQERLWEPFAEENPQWKVAFEQLREVFRFCEVHSRVLVRGIIHVPAGQTTCGAVPREVRQPPPCPYARCGVRPEDWGGISGTRIEEVWYCEECRQVLAAWREQEALIRRRRAGADPGGGS